MSEPVSSFFNSVERRSLLLQVATAWEKTPFFPNSEAPGRDGGVDCVHLLHAVYHACGVIPRITIPAQAMDHGQHSDRSVLVEAFESWPDLRARFRCVVAHAREAAGACIEEILPGDALLFRAGKVPHHAGVMLVGSEILHVMAPEGVRRARIGAVIRGHSIVGRLEAVYRPLLSPC